MKVAVLLVLVLFAMRATSWALQWILLRLPRIGSRVAIFAGNMAARAGGRGGGRLVVSTGRRYVVPVRP